MDGALFHDLRRTAVRNLEAAGVSRSVAMKLTGHKTEAAYRRYAIADRVALEKDVAKLAQHHDTAAAQRGYESGGGGTRTPKGLRPPHFECGALPVRATPPEVALGWGLVGVIHRSLRLEPPVLIRAPSHSSVRILPVGQSRRATNSSRGARIDFASLRGLRSLPSVAPSGSNLRFSSGRRTNLVSESSSRVRPDRATFSVGAPGFEPGTSATRTQRSTGLSHAPITNS